MRRADWLVDLGPGAGEFGGHVIGRDSPEKLPLRVNGHHSLTAAYLQGERGISVPAKRTAGHGVRLVLKGATGHNLKGDDFELPLGTFTCVTGVSGSGKSTLIYHTLYRLLANHFHKAKQVPLPYKDIEGLEHIDKVIQPALQAGKVVLCDRFTEATYAYQGGGRGLNDKKIADLENWVQGDLRPDLTIILDAPVETGRHRAGQRSAPDRIEKERNDFFERVRQRYLQLAEHYPERIAVVDASVAIDKVQDQIEHVLRTYGIID